MSVTSRSSKITLVLGTLAILVPSGVSAQQQGLEADREDIIVSGQQAEFDATMATEGPELKGIISARIVSIAV